MGKTNETGARGERIAEEYLRNEGFEILHRNWRTAHKEVDLIATEDGMLVIVEIKTRADLRFGFPEEAVSTSKQRHLREAAEVFLRLFPEHRTARFDVVSIIEKNGMVKDLRHFRDAF